ncbi:MAG: type II toxin-antitoxin system RelE/ParE family toxin [Ignavibacteria bacterium]|nr:type II toxin-antitoxin system RelE/ParE family toxin [Ignavibacteria bacterium]
MINNRFNVVFLKEAKEFLDKLNEKPREKIIFNIRKSQYLNDSELLKKLTENIWEFRTLYNDTHYRLFAFWDKSDKNQTLIIATNGFIKKSGKTPTKELKRAESLRIKYFENK